jgi:hypothetical protein
MALSLLLILRFVQNAVEGMGTMGVADTLWNNEYAHGNIICNGSDDDGYVRLSNFMWDPNSLFAMHSPSCSMDTDPTK